MAAITASCLELACVANGVPIPHEKFFEYVRMPRHEYGWTLGTIELFMDKEWKSVPINKRKVAPHDYSYLNQFLMDCARTYMDSSNIDPGTLEAFEET